MNSFDPFSRDMSSVFDAMDLFFPTSYKSSKQKSSGILANIRKFDDRYALELSAPGFSRDDFSLNIENNVLTVRVETSTDLNKDNSYIHREFSYNNFSRSWTLPDTVNLEMISAKYEAGLLLVDVPFSVENKTKSFKVSID
tara:strand:- start:182 stop:604 length:423 start_codon:yes stop_codon:yes gene_type:complete